MDPEEAVIHHILRQAMTLMLVMTWYYFRHVRPHLLESRKRHRKYSMTEKIPKQVKFLKRVNKTNDTDCHNILRMNRDTFYKFCFLLENLGGLTDSKYVGVPEKVASFLAILGHHTKNRIVKFAFRRSGHTISIHFHGVLQAVLRLHNVLLAKPEPIREDCEDVAWKPFKGCFGALDGTYIRVQVKPQEAPRYRNRKGTITVNVLGVCDKQMRFVYMLAGWEGSVADGRVLREALNKPNGFKVPQGCYYLVDCGYANAPGFLAPYRSIRYHLQEWTDGGLSPQNPKEYFNMKHSSARNVIERTFGLLKKRWAVLKSPMAYSIDTQNNIILACALIHNFCRDNMSRDPVEDESSSDESSSDEDESEQSTEFIDSVNSCATFNNWRDELAGSMFNEWRGGRRNRRSV